MDLLNKNISLDDFLKQTSPKKKSKLHEFKNDILKLRNTGLTYDRIRQFLKENDVFISVQAISNFYNRYVLEANESSENNQSNEKKENKLIEKAGTEENIEEKDEIENKRDEVLHEFISKNKPDIIYDLEKFEAEIISLYVMGYSLAQIVDFLNIYDLVVPKYALQKFINSTIDSIKKDSRPIQLKLQ